MTAENDADTDTDSLRLTAEELSFLLSDPQSRADREERNARANRARTERRRSDPAYAERLRNEDRLRQRRHRAKAAIGRPEPQPEPPVPLPALSAADALHRLEAHLESVTTPQAAQLRRRPDALRRYAAAFELYRSLSERGERPTRGALAAAFAARLGVALTPSQIQKLRDQVEGFARPGGPWYPG
ncbi:hypothetical protein [Azospirillum himalayense]|uniref:Uncharacterized protein n=1 Tax=Azospirillum himalayense TaxID=654847 RepID=A0ABW0G388_9PROT